MPHDAHPAAVPGRLLPQDAARLTRRAAALSVTLALVLVAMKSVAWAMSGSVGVLSSLADSALDAAASLATLAAVTYAAQPPDDEHRFGHGKAEAFAALFQAVLVGVAGTLVALEAARRLADPQPLAHGALALGVMAAATVLTLGLVWFQTRALRQTGSVATKGDRAHYLADIAANGVVAAGIILAGLGLERADALIGLLVAAWLVWTALDVAQGGIGQLMDAELPDEARAEIRALALSGGGLLDVHGLRTRAAGPSIHIQFHADLEPGLSLIEAHERMVAAERSILARYPGADILIHPDPHGAAAPHGQGDIRHRGAHPPEAAEAERGG